MPFISGSMGAVVKVAAWKLKYSYKDKSTNKPATIRVPIVHCAVHPKNRGGFYTQGKVCEDLLNHALKEGFSKDTSNSEAIGIEERPVEERQDGYADFKA